ncbi:hypothetical protein PVA17_19265 [Lysinibacillus sp. CNPSo 3705]|uniref:hypothetical protein n=1 Tax=Lysinibacillus sp. CNPSo 3705 TaxID=3028148 RepID=UPI0023632167|nr:hypothetical protein [Lysinibacillus sp. CNPSo 3705]MDD1504882.1 hypothetical protein [Lysinibacillus sp. CNPSo 3705]
MKESLIALVFFVLIGAGEGILEEYLKFMDEKNNEAEADNNQTTNQQPRKFWTKKRLIRFMYKCGRLLAIIIILFISFWSGLKITMNILNGELGNIDWRFVLLMPSYKIYKAFTKVMKDVMNNTDEAANDASKVYSGYNTVFEVLKSLHSSTSEKEIKKPTNNENDKNQ